MSLVPSYCSRCGQEGHHIQCPPRKPDPWESVADSLSNDYAKMKTELDNLRTVRALDEKTIAAQKEEIGRLREDRARLFKERVTWSATIEAAILWHKASVNPLSTPDDMQFATSELALFVERLRHVVDEQDRARKELEYR